MACLPPVSSGQLKMSSFGDKSAPGLPRRNSGRRTKHQAKRYSTGDLRLPRYNLRSKLKSSMQDGNNVKATKSTGHVCTTLFARAPSNHTGSFENETWEDTFTTSVPKRSASYLLLENAKSRSIHINNVRSSDCSQSIRRPIDKKVPLKPSLVSDASRRSKVVKHVQFTCESDDINYEVTKDDIKNSWLDTDVSRSIESTKNEFHDMVVSFGPTGRVTSSDVDLCKNGKDYMVRIQKCRLINEMLGQRANLRRSVLEEQARQKREGIVDAEELLAVASKHSKWGVEIAKSSWWLCRT